MYVMPKQCTDVVHISMHRYVQTFFVRKFSIIGRSERGNFLLTNEGQRMEQSNEVLPDQFCSVRKPKNAGCYP